jgi:hypothetical protein
MTTLPSDVRTPAPDNTQPLKRRGLLAAGAAFVAGLVAKLSETPVSAGTDGDVVLGLFNFSQTGTGLIASTPDQTVLTLESNGGGSGIGLHTVGNQFAVYGELLPPGNIGAGVAGFGRGASAGIQGVNNDGIGVIGVSSTATGVSGQSTSGFPIFGQVPSTSSANTIAVYAQNYSTYAGPGPGAGGFGIYGLCAKGHGLVGATASPGAAAVVGATNGVAGAYAAAFYGPVIVGGNFTVIGGAKSAAVPHPDGSHRRLYCLESPESWFEDFGTARLECGHADVAIDPDFAAVVDLSDYHVFITAYDGDHVLHVGHRTPAGFVVEVDQEIARLKGKKPESVSGTFSWRVVAKRKDIKSERLATVTIPPEPTLPPPVPDLPALARREV